LNAGLSEQNVKAETKTPKKGRGKKAAAKPTAAMPPASPTAGPKFKSFLLCLGIVPVKFVAHNRMPIVLVFFLGWLC
jgi:hypothetical protein